MSRISTSICWNFTVRAEVLEGIACQAKTDMQDERWHLRLKSWGRSSTSGLRDECGGKKCRARGRTSARGPRECPSPPSSRSRLLSTTFGNLGHSQGIRSSEGVMFVIENYCTDPGICPIPLSFKSKLRQWWYTKGASHSTSNDSPHVWRAHEAGQREHSTKSWRVDISSPLITGQLVNETVFLSFNGVVFFSDLIYAIAIWVKATSCRNSIGPSMYCWLDGTCNFGASTSVWAQRSMMVFLPKTKITGRRQVLHGIRYSLKA